MQGVREIANFIFWMDNTKHILVDDAMENKRMMPKDKRIILEQIQDENPGGLVIKTQNIQPPLKPNTP